VRGDQRNAHALDRVIERSGHRVKLF